MPGKSLHIKLASTVLFLFVACVSYSQQQAQYSQYLINEYLVNPALSGVEDFVDIKVGYRTQWVGIDNHPETYYLSAHASIGKSNGAMTHKSDYGNWHGVGGLFYRDKTGPTSQTSAYLNYAYNLKITQGEGFNVHHKDGIRLSFGTFIGLNQYTIDGSQLTAEQADDIAIVGNSQTTTLPDASIGGMLYFRDQYFVGLSAFQLLGSKIEFNEPGTPSSNNNLTEDGKLTRHYYLSFAYKKKIKDDFYFIPSSLVKFTSPAPVSVDLNAWLDYKDIIYGGISYRTGDAVGIIIGTLLFEQVEFYYSYDYTLSELNVQSQGSHEITLGYRILSKFKDRNHSQFK